MSKARIETKTEYAPLRCGSCGFTRKLHSYYERQKMEEAGGDSKTLPCRHFRPTPLQVDYRPPEGDRGVDPARFSTTVVRQVQNHQAEVVEIHTYHEAEMRQLDKCGRTGLSRMQLVMPDTDEETDDWRDVDGDRSYRRQYLLFNPSSLYLEGGAWVRVEGFAYHSSDQDGLSSWGAAGPDLGTTVIRQETWRQYVPRDAITWGDEPADETPEEPTADGGGDEEE